MYPLTEKDLSFAKDAVSWELIAAKKAYQYSFQTQDQECRQLFEQVARQHQQSAERIIQHVGQHMNQLVQAQSGMQANFTQQLQQ